MDRKDVLKDRNRDNYFRCHICGDLYHQELVNMNTTEGYICPKGCEVPFIQPPYETPIDDD